MCFVNTVSHIIVLNSDYFRIRCKTKREHRQYLSERWERAAGLERRKGAEAGTQRPPVVPP